MKLSIAAIGHGRNAPENQLAQSWFQKLPHRGLLIEHVSKFPAGAKRQADESARILNALPPSAHLIALDPYGRDTSSEELAELIRSCRDQGIREAVFAIGGADGHDKTLLDRAAVKMAFGRQTWPHMLFRAMVAEQLYRAEMILIGHPYHHA
ncbi:MAG: 23S rRNA (pseudouridine(1915)-N(3))-methyltransferase RlmH [Alphaproteobacteria bacterium]|nr:23S rRNA (pseudouridine(1915)-N(3))-methyltransferase RlmH [Alphaproteobacteria bacterium]